MTEVNVVGLAEILTHASRTVPRYYGLITTDEIPPCDALKVLHSLPFLTREEVRTEKPRLWSTVGEPKSWKTVRTSGTTGIPIEIAVDEIAQRAELASLARQIDACTVDSDWRDRSVVHLTLHSGASSRTLACLWSPQSNLVKWNLSRLWQQSDDCFLERLKEIDGQIVTLMPSVAALLLDRVRYPGRIHPLLIILSGEAANDDLLRRITTTFGCPVTCLYTLAEMGIAANGCLATNGYHVNDHDAFIEVVNENGDNLGPGLLGSVAITSLANRAMPLIRYLTGDRAMWVDAPCGCSQRGRLFRLHTARALAVVAKGPTGRRITHLDVAKLFAQLDVDAVRLEQTGSTVIVGYRASSGLTAVAATAISAALRGLLGPGMQVEIRRMSQLTPKPGPVKRPATIGLPPPTFLQPQEIATWARRWLTDKPGIAAAVLTGSTLDPSATSRFSDIDIAILVNHERDNQRWSEMAIAMHQHLTGLRVNVTTAQALSESPLITCRLLTERYPILGELERCGVVWPTKSDLSSEARFWAQDAWAVLWTRLTAPDRLLVDPLREAWIATKYATNALRYYYLCRGDCITKAVQIIGLAEKDGLVAAQRIRTAFDVAREHRPPPSIGSGSSNQYLLDALSVIEWMRNSLNLE